MDGNGKDAFASPLQYEIILAMGRGFKAIPIGRSSVIEIGAVLTEVNKNQNGHGPITEKVLEVEARDLVKHGGFGIIAPVWQPISFAWRMEFTKLWWRAARHKVAKERHAENI